MNMKNADQKRDGAFDDDIETASVMSDHSDCSTSGFDPTTGTWVVASRSKKKSKRSKCKATETTEMLAGMEREEEEEANDSTVARTSPMKGQMLCNLGRLMVMEHVSSSPRTILLCVTRARPSFTRPARI